MQSKNIQTNLTAKDILNKLLKEHLDNNLLNLEQKNQKEIDTLSLINNSYKEILNNLLHFSENSKNKTENKEIKEIKEKIPIPKLKLKINNNNLNKSQYIKNKTQRSKNVELFVGIDSILKNKKHYNKRNKEEPILTNVKNNNNEIKTKVSFNSKSAISRKELNITPDQIRRHKPFINNYLSNKKGKSFIRKSLTGNNSSLGIGKKKKSEKNYKCLTERNGDINVHITPIKLNDKSKKKYANISFNANITENKSKISKKGYKTAINFYTKKSKTLMNNSINEFKFDNSQILTEKKIIEKEKNLKLCDSLLMAVNKDEILVNSKNILLNDDNELIFKKLSFTNEDGKRKNKNNKLLYDKFKSCIQYIINFLTIHDIFNICQTQKEVLKIVINLQIKKTKKSIDDISLFLKAKNINVNDSSLSKKLKPFELSIISIKAISTLNSISKANFIKSIMSYNEQKNINTNINNNNNIIRKIILIFDIYFIALGKKKIINDFNDNNNKKIEHICYYFKNNKNKSIGVIIQNDLNGKKFDDFIINSLYEYSYKYINIINPSYFKQINKDIAIFVFLIKNILDYVGISTIESKGAGTHGKSSEQKMILINKSRLNIYNILLSKYNQILNKFNK